jgi:broad specificity phosphatase PhoE/thiamine kinase-like enzyme
MKHHLLFPLIFWVVDETTALSQRGSLKKIGFVDSTDAASTSPATPPVKTINVLILRHGQSDANALDVIQGSGYKSRLTQKGRQQAKDVAVKMEEMLKETSVDSVYCSPLSRALTTWEIIQQECNLFRETQATILQDLREIDFYDWEGIDKTNLNRMFPREFAAWKQVRPDELVVYNSADSTQKKPTKHYPLLELWERADRVWNELFTREQISSMNAGTAPQTILLVAHGSLGQALLGTAMGWDATHFRNHAFPNCGMAEIQWRLETPRLGDESRPLASRWRWKHPSSKSHRWNHPHNNDILRDLDGNPLTNEYFMRVMQIDHVPYFNTPKTELSAFRGLMSDGARVQLYPSQRTAFYKRIVFSDLDHAQEKLKKAPFKLRRDTRSYQVVASWLSSRACRMLCEDTGVHIPTCYDAQVRADHDHPMNSRFSFLLEDFNPSQGWYQEWLLDDPQEIKAALTTLAKIHAYFWHGSDFWKNDEAAKELEASIWKSGSYVQPKAQNDNQCFVVAEEWDKKKQAFADSMGHLPFWDNLGERLQSVCVQAGRLAHPFADDLDEETTDTSIPKSSSLSQQYGPYRTFTHGDPKQANFFFRQKDESGLSVGLIDFQWSGFGLAATDIAHFLLSSVHADHLVHGGEERYQRYYYDELRQYLVEYGAYDDKVAVDFSLDLLLEQYDTAVLDLCRLIVAYTWNRFTEAVDKKDAEGKARTMNKTSYNKSVSNAVYLMSRCHGILKKRGV